VSVPLQSWVKTCDTNKSTKQELCLIAEDIRADSGTFIASITLRQLSSEKKTSVLAQVPLGMSLKPGLKLQVDNAAPLSLLYGICDVHNCYGLADLEDSFIASMKGGKQLVLTTYSQQGKPVVFTLPLTTFGAALGSKGLDPAAYQKFQQARAAAFRVKADQARQALLKGEQQGTPDNPAPAQ
jgi:invasion protein IalB